MCFAGQRVPATVAAKANLQDAAAAVASGFAELQQELLVLTLLLQRLGQARQAAVAGSIAELEAAESRRWSEEQGAIEALPVQVHVSTP